MNSLDEILTPCLLLRRLSADHLGDLTRIMQKAGFRYERDLVYSGLPHVLYRLRRAEVVRESVRETER